mmetsp:Transcript_5809/g.9915  ORF Transcript_5809/g.9915 Transcript_5809/m.9915 type:complete len:1008 (+) Transcript_5809:57-3080(+)
MMIMRGAIVAVLHLHVVFCREVQNFDSDWLFELQKVDQKQHCEDNEFPEIMDGSQCYGLKHAEYADQNVSSCRDACCQMTTCEVWQYCAEGAGCNVPNTCWIGKKEGSCNKAKGWTSRGRTPFLRPPNSKCTNARCVRDTDDSKWKNITLPHDFVLENEVKKDGTDPMHGFKQVGIGWYRKHFKALAKSDATASVWLEFDGIYRDSQIWLNGHYIGGQASGYTSFNVPLQNYLKYGKDNVLAVRADAEHWEGWWYEGGGIYRHARLVYAHSAYMQDVYVAPTVEPSSISDDSRKATVSVDATVEVVNKGPESRNMIGVVSIFDLKRVKVGYQERLITVPRNDTRVFSVKFNLFSANLWGTENPYLYQAKVDLFDNEESIDDFSRSFGARHIAWDKDKGLFLNNKSVKIKGFCNHQDFAGVGVAVPDRINKWKVTKLQEMGTNAWRMSHGPPNPELLDYTDQQGMLVMDEHRSYCQNSQRICNDTGFLQDLAHLVRRDRNHPSVIMWSFCNEAGCSNHANDHQALADAQEMKKVVQANDPWNTRAVTGGWYSQWAGISEGWSAKVMDVQGINYFYKTLDRYHETFPQMPVVSSEAASCYATRGEYFTNKTAGHIDSYSTYDCTKLWWDTVSQRDWIAGGFGWTGFDYHGEALPTFWPAVNSNFGVIDIAGFPKDTFYWHKAWWTDKKVLHLLPHWNEPVGFLHKDNNETCGASSFPVNQTGFQCWGLKPREQEKSVEACMQACCSDANCEQWAWNTHANTCYNGALDVNQCSESPNWVGGGVRKIVKVWAYTNADQVELFLNGKSVGKQEVPRLDKVQWKVPYEPGILMAIGYNKDGKAISKKIIQTTGPPHALRLEVEDGHDKLKADGSDAGLVTVKVVDEDGHVVPNADNKVEFSVEGVGRIIGVGNGDPASHEPERASYRHAYNGLARVIVGASQEEGFLKLKATSEGLKGTSIKIAVLEQDDFCRANLDDLVSHCSSKATRGTLPSSLLQHECPYPSWYLSDCL